MAAPEDKSIHNLTGKWAMNKTLSDDFEPVLTLQGMGFITRKALGAAYITLCIKEYEDEPVEADEPLPAELEGKKATHIHIDQFITGGVKGTSEHRCIDGRARSHADWLFGTVEGRTNWVRGPNAGATITKEWGASRQSTEGGPGDFTDEDGEFLGEDWPETDDLILSYVKNLDTTATGGWEAVQAWGFEMIGEERRYTRHVLVRKGKDQRVAVRLVYDYLGELDEDDEAYGE